jgi:hypothetical protein
MGCRLICGLLDVPQKDFMDIVSPPIPDPDPLEIHPLKNKRDSLAIRNTLIHRHIFRPF